MGTTIMTLLRVFLLAALTGIGTAVAVAKWPLPSTPNPQPAVGRALWDGVHVREQVGLADVDQLGREGYRTLIDLRPDGEVADQPSSSQVGAAAARAGLRFAYVPTPRGDIPGATVEMLLNELAGAERPVMLYCRSGSRAARVWALVEASRADGPDATSIADAVRRAGQHVDDLIPRIAARISARPSRQ